MSAADADAAADALAAASVDDAPPAALVFPELKRELAEGELPLRERFELCRSVAEECVTDADLVALLAHKANPIAYDGFEPSGRLHLAQCEFFALSGRRAPPRFCRLLTSAQPRTVSPPPQPQPHTHRRPQGHQRQQAHHGRVHVQVLVREREAAPRTSEGEMRRARSHKKRSHKKPPNRQQGCGLVRAVEQQDGRRPQEDPDRREVHDRGLEGCRDGSVACRVHLFERGDQFTVRLRRCCCCLPFLGG